MKTVFIFSEHAAVAKSIGIRIEQEFIPDEVKSVAYTCSEKAANLLDYRFSEIASRLNDELLDCKDIGIFPQLTAIYDIGIASINSSDNETREVFRWDSVFNMLILAFPEVRWIPTKGECGSSKSWEMLKKELKTSFLCVSANSCFYFAQKRHPSACFIEELQEDELPEVNRTSESKETRGVDSKSPLGCYEDYRKNGIYRKSLNIDEESSIEQVADCILQRAIIYKESHANYLGYVYGAFLSSEAELFLKAYGEEFSNLDAIKARLIFEIRASCEPQECALVYQLNLKALACKSELDNLHRYQFTTLLKKHAKFPASWEAAFSPFMASFTDTWKKYFGEWEDRKKAKSDVQLRQKSLRLRFDLYTELAEVFREYGFVNLEQLCSSEARIAHRKLMGANLSIRFKDLKKENKISLRYIAYQGFRPVFWMIETSLKSIGHYFAVLVAAFCALWAIYRLGYSKNSTEALHDAIYGFFATEPRMNHERSYDFIFSLIPALSVVTGIFFLGILTSLVYTRLSRK